MATLTGKTIASTYTSLLKLEGDTQTLVAGGGTAIQVKTGDNEVTPIYLNTNRIGIGTATPASSLDIEGNLSIGASYSGTTAAPANGVIIEGNVGIGLNAPTAPLHIDQSSSSEAKTVLKLDQADIDDSFIDFIGTSAGDSTRSVSSSTGTGSTKVGAIMIEVNGVTKWIRIYDTAV